MTLPRAFSPEQLAELLSEAGRAELARPAKAFDPRDAEIMEGVEVRWYVVSVFSRDAEIEMAKRRFGIFVPATEEAVLVRGRKITRHLPLVPGYVFVLLWDTDANYLRIAKTFGVDKVLGWVDDNEIDKLRFNEACEQLDANARRRVVVSVINSARRRPRTVRRQKRKDRKRGKTGCPA